VTGRWHDNRHTLITDLAESGAADETIRDIAGQSLRRRSSARLLMWLFFALIMGAFSCQSEFSSVGAATAPGTPASEPPAAGNPSILPAVVNQNRTRNLR
jgi:hypothetical protein